LGDLGAGVDLEADPERAVLGDAVHGGHGADGDAGHPDRVSALQPRRVLDHDGQRVGALEDAHAADGEGDEAEDDDDAGTDGGLEPQVRIDHGPPPRRGERKADSPLERWPGPRFCPYRAARGWSDGLMVSGPNGVSGRGGNGTRGSPSRASGAVWS